MFSSETEVFHNFSAWSGSAVVVDGDDCTFVTCPLCPPHGRPSFYRNALFNTFGQNNFAIPFLLRFKQLPTWHAYHAGANPVVNPLVISHHAKRNFRAGTD